MSGVEKQAPLRPLVADLNPALMCRLCGGYYVDAAAIIECLHAFCKSCLVRYLETNKYCPICDVQVHKSRPLQNIRLDPTLQDMVYKLVPGLYHKEMKSRREFYSSRPDAPPSSLEDRGETPPELCPFYTPDEPVSLVLEYKPPEVESDPDTNIKDSQSKRFLRCPAAVKITHLEKLLRNKYGLDNRYNIDLMLEDSKLPPDLTLMDVAYAFGRKRKGQFLFTYRIYDSQCKKMRLSDCDMDTLPPPEIKAEVNNEPAGNGNPASAPAPTTSTATCVSTPLPAPTTTTSSGTTPLSSAAAAPVTPAAPATPATSAIATSVAPAVFTTATPSALTITPVSAAAMSAPKSIPVSTNTFVTTTAPSLKVSVQRLSPATVKSIASAPARVDKSPASSTDKSNKLDSIISRLGDPSKHRPEAAQKKEFKKAQGKEVQLRISENGEMITNVVQNDKSPPPQPKSAATQPRPGTPQPRPGTPQQKPATPQPNPATPQQRPATPQSHPATPQPRPATPQSNPAAPQPKPATPQSNPAAPQPKPTASQPRPATPQSNPAAPQPRPGTPQSKPAAPHPRPGTPQSSPAAPQPRPGTPQSSPAAPQPRPGTPQSSPAAPQLRPGTPQSNPAASQPRPGTPQSNPAASQPRPGTPQSSPAAPQPRPGTPQSKPAAPQLKPATPQPNPVALPAKAAAPVVKPTPKVSNSSKAETCLSSESPSAAPKAGVVSPVSPSGAASPRKPGSSPVGYKTLKAGPKSWNPTISRNSFLSAKLELQQQQVQKAQQQQNKDGQPGAAKSPLPDPPKPPRFFKARNTPRYLGAPASGVKPMYQVASPPPSVQKPKPAPKPPSVLKLNPKTLTPMTAASAAASSPPPPKDRPPFLSTTISGSNHLPASRGLTTTSTTVTENLSKMSSSDVAMRSSPSAPTPHPYMRLFSYCDSLNPFPPRLGDPNRIPSSPPYSLLRAPFSPLLANSYGLSGPAVGMLYNQSLHRQANHTGPLSPVPGLPSPLPPSSAPLSPSATLKNIIPPVPWGPASPLSPQPSKKPSTEVQPKLAEKQTKVNGEKRETQTQAKDKSACAPSKPPQAPQSVEAEKKEGETKAASVKEKSKEHKSSEQDNNNTVVIEKKAESVVELSQLSHNISKLCTPANSLPNSASAVKDKQSPAPNKPADKPPADQVAIKQT